MNALDIAVLAVVALSAIFAFARGFMREALSIIAWGGAALIAYYSFDPLYPLVSRAIHTPLLAYVIDGGGVFLASLIALTILTGYLARFVRFGALSPIDRTLGLLFGLARGVAVVCLAYLLLDISVPRKDRPSWISQARSTSFLHEGADMLRNVLPASLRFRSADASGGAIAQAQAADRAMRALATPVLPQPAKPAAAAPNYRPGERRALDRVIDNMH